MAVGNNGATTTSCQLLNQIEKIASLRLWFWAISLFSLFCIYNTYIYISNVVKCGVQVSYKEIPNEFHDETTTTLPILETTASQAPDHEKKSYIWQHYKEVNNDIVLEYDSVPNTNGSDVKFQTECQRKTCSRVFVNGTLYSKPMKRNVSEKSEATHSPNPIIDLHWTPMQVDKIRFSDQTNLSDKTNILSCQAMQNFWSSEEYLNLEVVKQSEKQSQHKIIIKKGLSLKFFFPNVYEIVTKEAHQHTWGYSALLKEYLKREEIGWNWEGLPVLLGACKTDTYIRFITQYYKGQKLCESTDIVNGTYVPGSCFLLTSFHNFLKKQEDEAESALLFVKSLVCFIGEVEERRLFIENFHGSQITILPDLSIRFEDLDSMFFYGEENILGGTICGKSRDCPMPHSKWWKQDGTNIFFYSKCEDHRPVCKESRCIGFNASLHLCGMARWAIVAMISHMKTVNDRTNLIKISARVSAPQAIGRSSGKNLCKRMSYLLSVYAIEKKKKLISNGVHQNPNFGKQN